MLALLILVKVWYLCRLKIQEEIENFYTFHKKKVQEIISQQYSKIRRKTLFFCSKKIKKNYLKRKEISSTRRYQSLNQMIITTIYVYLSAPRIQNKLSYFLMSELHVLSFILWKVTYGAFTWWWHFLLVLKGFFCRILFDIF